MMQIQTNIAKFMSARKDSFQLILAEAVHLGRFREDLFYRLDVFPITLPAVRNRAGNVPLIVDYFLKRFNRTHQTNILGVSPECINRQRSAAILGITRRTLYNKISKYKL